MPMPEMPEQMKPAPKLVIVVSGGCIQSMHCNVPLGMDIVVVDHDNIAEQRPDGDEIEADTIADCPLAVGWDCAENLLEEEEKEEDVGRAESDGRALK